MTTITRLYEAESDARAAVADLKQSRYRENEIDLFSGGSGAVAEDLAASISAAGVPDAGARAFAVEVAGGKTLVVVRPVLGAAAKAIAILDDHGPIPANVGRVEYTSASAADSRLTTERMGMPLLLSDPAPLSKLMSIPTLLDSVVPATPPTGAPSAKPRWNGFVFGEPKLFNNPAPVSVDLGLPVLLNERRRADGDRSGAK